MESNRDFALCVFRAERTPLLAYESLTETVLTHRGSTRNSPDCALIAAGEVFAYHTFLKIDLKPPTAVHRTDTTTATFERTLPSFRHHLVMPVHRDEQEREDGRWRRYSQEAI